MSKIFNYSSIKDTVAKAMLPGQKSRVSNVDTIVAKPSSVTAEIEDGMLVKLVEGRVEPLAAGDTASDVFGIVVQDLRAQRRGGSFTFGGAQHITGYVPGTNVSVMLKGFIYVPVADTAEIEAGAPVNIVKTKADGKEVGVVVSTGGEVLPNAVFTGNYGFPLSSKQDGTTASKLTAKTAEIAIDFTLKA